MGLGVMCLAQRLGAGGIESGGILRSELPAQLERTGLKQPTPRALHPMLMGSGLQPPAGSHQAPRDQVLTWLSSGGTLVLSFMETPFSGPAPKPGSRRGGASGLWWSTTVFRAGTTGSPVSLAESLRRALSGFKKQ